MDARGAWNGRRCGQRTTHSERAKTRGKGGEERRVQARRPGSLKGIRRAICMIGIPGRALEWVSPRPAPRNAWAHVRI